MAEITSLDFGQWMKETRKELGMSQKRLATKSFCHENSIGRWERGEQYPPLDEAEQIAKVLGAELVIREYGTNERTEN